MVLRILAKYEAKTAHISNFLPVLGACYKVSQNLKGLAFIKTQSDSKYPRPERKRHDLGIHVSVKGPSQ